MATILLIDDDDQIRVHVKIVLEDAGYCFGSVASGKHGLRFLQDQEMEVDLMLVDIFMPDMDGLELIPVLRKTRPGHQNYCDHCRGTCEELSRRREAFRGA